MRYDRLDDARTFARVARGDAALTLSRGPKSEWDVCAGVLLVEEAGGVATDAPGAPLLFNSDTALAHGIVCGAPDAHRHGLQLVRSGPCIE